MDWNLLSTASPAITAWMNPSNRFAIKLVAMIKAFHLRRTAVAACLMANGLEVPGIQKKPKVDIINKLNNVILKIVNTQKKISIFRAVIQVNLHHLQKHFKKIPAVNCVQ